MNAVKTGVCHSYHYYNFFREKYLKKTLNFFPDFLQIFRYMRGPKIRTRLVNWKEKREMKRRERKRKGKRKEKEKERREKRKTGGRKAK